MEQSGKCGTYIRILWNDGMMERRIWEGALSFVCHDNNNTYSVYNMFLDT